MSNIKKIEKQQMEIAEEIYDLKQLIENKKQQLILLEEEKKYYAGFSYKAPVCEEDEIEEEKRDWEYEEVQPGENFSIDILKHNVVEIRYEKKNGDIVIKEITLMSNFIIDYVSQKGGRTLKDGHFYGFDINDNRFKDWIYDKIISYKILPGF
jgi:hypothetical protein